MINELLPNVFIVGAPKCGTTSLARWLAKHEQVCLTNPKETLYWWRNHHRREYDFQEKHLSHYSGEKVILEASAYTASIPYAIERLPSNAKIIYCVREPLARAYSEWNMRKNIMPGHAHKSFDIEMYENLKTYSIHNNQVELDVQPYLDPIGGILKRIILEQGAYGTNYRRLMNRFDEEQIMVVDIDSINFKAQQNIICDFLKIKRQEHIMMTFENVAKEKTAIKDVAYVLAKHPDISKLMLELYIPEVYLLASLTKIDFPHAWWSHT